MALDPEQERIRILRAYQNVFNTPDGQTVLEHLKEATNFYRSHLPGGIVQDVNNLIASEARRGVVLDIINNVKANLNIPTQTTAILEEPNNG